MYTSCMLCGFLPRFIYMRIYLKKIFKSHVKLQPYPILMLYIQKHKWNPFRSFVKDTLHQLYGYPNSFVLFIIKILLGFP